MRKSHENQIERWANFVRENPNKWKEEHTKFINAIFEKHKDFIDRLKATPGGEEKIKLLYQR